MNRLNRICMLCNIHIDGVVHSCFLPIEKNDRFELSGCEQCLKGFIKKWDGKKRTLEETKRLIGLEVE